MARLTADFHVIPLHNLSSDATARLMGMPTGASIHILTSGPHAVVPLSRLPEGFVDLLTEHNQLDAALYKFATELYEKRIMGWRSPKWVYSR
jgi:hypothetical protein